jgi:hypothetical protein
VETYASLVPDDQSYWLTRDRFRGVLSPEIDVWVCRPVPEIYPNGDVLWLAPLEIIDLGETYHSALTIEQAHQAVGEAVPDSPRQCVRVGA